MTDISKNKVVASDGTIWITSKYVTQELKKIMDLRNDSIQMTAMIAELINNLEQ